MIGRAGDHADTADIEAFNTPGFFSELRERSTEKMDRQATEAGHPTA